MVLGIEMSNRSTRSLDLKLIHKLISKFSHLNFNTNRDYEILEYIYMPTHLVTIYIKTPNFTLLYCLLAFNISTFTHNTNLVYLILIIFNIIDRRMYY